MNTNAQIYRFGTCTCTNAASCKPFHPSSSTLFTLTPTMPTNAQHQAEKKQSMQAHRPALEDAIEPKQLFPTPAAAVAAEEFETKTMHQRAGKGAAKAPFEHSVKIHSVRSVEG